MKPVEIQRTVLASDTVDDMHFNRVKCGSLTLWIVAIALLAGVTSPAFAFQEAAVESAMPTEPEPPIAKPADAASPAARTEAADESPSQKSFLQWLVDASGPFGACIFVESFLMVAVIIICLLQIRRPNFMPPDFVTEFEEKLNVRDYQGAYNLAKTDESLLARLLAAGMSKFQKGPDAIVKAMTELGEDENMLLEHRLNYLALIATTAPMFGLLGTVQGMVQAFDEIANSNTTPKPSELAAGIQLALVTTLEGLIVAIPAMIAYSLLRNRLIRLMFDIGRQSEDLINRLQSRPAAPATPVPAVPQSGLS